MNERYSRHISLQEIGVAGQEKLNRAKVLVIGAGGLGCPVLQYLAAAGVGTLGIVDFDRVERSNLQRQILFGTQTIGDHKALAAKAVLEHLNDTITINAYAEALTAQNSIDLFNRYDIIVDGTDNFATRYLISDTAILTRKPVVYGAIYKFEGQVAVFNYNQGPSYRCLFSTPPKPKSIPNCSEIGVLGVLPGIIGTLQANEVLKLILDIGKPLSGQVYCYNALTNASYSIHLKRNEAAINAILQNGLTSEDPTPPCLTPSEVNIINLEDALVDASNVFIDVREAHEVPKIEDKRIIHIPLSVLENKLPDLQCEGKIIMFCQSGQRSQQAVSMAQQHNINHCFSLSVGASALANALKSPNHG